jgi:hypothetical protein
MNMTFYEALTNYVDAHFKPIETPKYIDPEDDDGDWVCDHYKWQGESAWILETHHLDEVERFIEDLIEHTARFADVN